MRHISIFGTSSDAGKSTLTFVIARLLQRRGIKTVPFKAQNVSNNSNIADDGSEIAISTFFQAEVLGVPTSHHLNPVLLKSGSFNSASLIINGKEVGRKDVLEYYRDIDLLKPHVKKAFLHLDKKYDCIVAEGAGGCVELNLLDKDLSNTYIAEEFNTKIILVADIEKGGVFASIYGTIALMKEQFRANLIGVIVNKFRGDRSLFDDGVKIIEEQFKIPVLGVLPYLPLNVGFEDIASLQNYVQKKRSLIRVGIINFPHMSNFNDFEPLILEPTIQVDFIHRGLEQYDYIILPGSKRVVEDLLWMQDLGLDMALKNYNKKIIAICGGYEMLFSRILDHDLVESPYQTFEALGYIDDDIVFLKEKITKRTTFHLHGMELKGYEIHYGTSFKYPLFYEDAKIFGTFLHGIFDNDAFKQYIFNELDDVQNFYEEKQRIVNEFVETMGGFIDVGRILKEVRTSKQLK